MPQEDKPKLV
jgi:hypothetical protein